MVRWEQSQMNITDAATARNKKQLGIKTSEYWSWILIQLKHSTNMLRPWIDSKISLIIFNIDYSLVVTPATLVRTNKQVESQNARMAAWEGDALEKQVYPKKEEQSTNTSLLVIMYRNFSAGSSGKKIRKEVIPDQEEQRRPTRHKTEALGN